MTAPLRGFVLGSGAPVGIRTPNLLIRSQMLYPVELRAPGRGRKLTKALAKRKQPGRLSIRGKTKLAAAAKPVAAEKSLEAPHPNR